jgi:hypothetical protein
VSLPRVIELLSHNKIVTINKVSYALIDDRIHWVTIINDEMKLLNHDPKMTVNEFAIMCELFDPSLEGAIRDIPFIPELYSEDFEYVFTKMPKKQECPHCQKLVTRDREEPNSAVFQGKFAYCPFCGYRLYRALRADGTREDGLDFSTNGYRISVNHPKISSGVKPVRQKVEKPKEKTTEEIMESGILKPMQKKLKFKRIAVLA